VNVFLTRDKGDLSDFSHILDHLVEQNAVPPSPGIVAFDCSSCQTLSGGSTYWVVAETGQGDVIDWHFNDIGDDSAFAVTATGPSGSWHLETGGSSRSWGQ
jgi:hypothetical protein